MSRRRRRAPAAGEPRMTVLLSRPGLPCEHIRAARISDVLPEEGTVLWVDLADPGPRELETLREEFGFHRLALEDVAAQGQRPKIDEYPGYFFVVLRAPFGDSAGELETAEIHLFIGRNYVVTAHHGDLPALSDAIHRWEGTEAELRGQVGFLVHVISDAVIDAYFPVVDRLEEELDQLEIAMFGERPVYDARQLLKVKRELHALRRAVYPMREVFNTFLRRDSAVFSADTYPYFQDVYDHVLRLLDTIDIERDLASGALEAQLSVVSNRLNETMKRLTVVAICVAIMGAIFGAWGMNFTEVPLARLGLSGFAVLVGCTFCLVGAALALLKRLQLW